VQAREAGVTEGRESNSGRDESREKEEIDKEKKTNKE
jgi:hypothetical protein